MGSLNSRWYIKFLGGEAKVDDWVSLGGPNHGTETANFCFSTSCVEMRVGSKFLGELNAGDETPGTVNYGTWWSPCDEIINPDSSVAAQRRDEHENRVHLAHRADDRQNRLRTGARIRQIGESATAGPWPRPGVPSSILAGWPGSR